MTRLRFAIVLLAAAPALRAQGDAPPLQGRVDNGIYTAPTGSYRIPVPVEPELGGTIIDTENLTVFSDDYSTYITITALPMDAAQKWELEVRGLKSYLAYYFENSVLPEFKRVVPGTREEETGIFLSASLGGSLVTYALLPGGSMFTSKTPSVFRTAPPTAKRGYLIFVKDNFVYVISAEMAERALEGSAYAVSDREEDLLLRQRLLQIAGKMQFLIPPPAKAAP